MRSLHSTYLIAVTAGIIGLTACVGDPGPEVDLAAEEAAIREANARWMAAFQAHDAAGEAAAFTADGVEYRMFAEPVIGPSAIEAHDTEFFAANPTLHVSWATEEVHVATSGDMAIQTGTFHATGVGPNADQEDRGRMLTVWKKEEGEWKVWHAMVNPTSPPPPADTGQ